MISDGYRNWRSVMHVVGAIVLIVLVGAVVATVVPELVGAEETFTVQSDSMSPAIEAGSVIFVTSTPAADLSVGDVITFRSVEADKRVTHRIVEVVGSGQERTFRTKGDANTQADDELVDYQQVIGRVSFTLPLLGWLFSFAQTRAGIVVLLIVPAVLLGASELWDLYRHQSSARRGGNGP